MADLDVLQFDHPSKRLFAGLAWDENPEKEKNPFAKSHDLDLCCLLLSGGFRHISLISPETLKDENLHLQILHTGDHTTGSSSLEDEEILINLNKLDMDVQYMVFYVRTKKNLSFKEVESPFFHIADGSTYRRFLSVNLAEQDYGEYENENKSNVIFVTTVLERVPSNNLDGDDWVLHPVKKFIYAHDYLEEQFAGKLEAVLKEAGIGEE